MLGVRELTEADADAIAALSAAARADARRLAKANLARLEQRLAKLEPGSWGAAAAEATRAQLLLALRELARDQTAGQSLWSRRAGEAGARQTAAYLTALDRHYLGAVRPLRFDHLEWYAQNAEQYSQTRLRVFETSWRRYGAQAVQAVERELARSIMVGETWAAARETVMGATRGVVVDQAWMVDRITRTETSAAYNGVRLQALVAEDRPGDRMSKMLSATFDDRTGQDSVLLHGQKRPVDQPFLDVSGREYMAPPNRPHDREVVVPWRDSWGSPDGPPVETPPSLAFKRVGLPVPPPEQRREPNAALLATQRQYREKMRRLAKSLPSLATAESRAATEASVAQLTKKLRQLDRLLEL